MYGSRLKSGVTLNQAMQLPDAFRNAYSRVWPLSSPSSTDAKVGTGLPSQHKIKSCFCISVPTDQREVCDFARHLLDALTALCSGRGPKCSSSSIALRVQSAAVDVQLGHALGP